MTKTPAIIILLFVFAAGLFGQEVELTGEVVTVTEVTEDDNDVPVLQAQIRVRTQERVMLELGPAWYIEDDIAEGDVITVRGKYLEANKVRVREMVCNTVRTILLDDEYSPLWLRTRLRAENHVYDPRTETTVKGEVTDLYIVEDYVASTMEAMVKTQAGELVRVRLAPEWYLKNRLRIGDEIELRGSAVKDKGEMMIVAREMRNLKTHLEIALRNAQGFPDWRGKVEGMHNKQQGRPRYQDEPVIRGLGPQ